MNGIQGCVYIVGRGAVIPRIEPDEEKSSVATKWKDYGAEVERIRQERVGFSIAAVRYRASSLKLRHYTVRNITDDSSGLKELETDYLGNDSVVLLDAEHLLTVRSLLIADSRAQGHGSQILLYEGGEFKDLLALQAANLLSA